MDNNAFDSGHSSIIIPNVDYIFNDDEFESSNFDCTLFVLKYQKAITLETLKHELKTFIEYIKQQLYNTINKDYKDFIQIAMKLEGVDVRLSLMKAPITSLHTDVNALYDTLISSLNTIQTSIRNKKSINDRKHFLHISQECCKHIVNIEAVLYASTAVNLTQNDDSILNNNSLVTHNRRQQLQRILFKGDKVSGGKDEFMCSEIERAAFELMHAHAAVIGFILESEEEQESSDNEEARLLRLKDIQSELGGKLSHLKDRLVVRVTERMGEILQAGITSPLAHSQSNAANALFSHRSFLHLFRAFIILNRGEICENLIAEKVVNPLLREHVSHSRVDGAEGRGSFAGLKMALEGFMREIASRVGNIVLAAEMHLDTDTDACRASSRAPLPVDLVLNSIVLPTLTYLDSHFDNMVSLAIPNLFHHCYSAILRFKKDCTALGTSVYASRIMARLDRSIKVISFHDKWKLELYLQLRSHEYFDRVDGYCNLVSNSIVDPFPKESIESIIQSLPPLDLKDLADKHSYLLPIAAFFAVELHSLLHPSIFIPALGPKIFSLCIRILSRFELFIATTIKMPTPSFADLSLHLSTNGADSNTKARLVVRDYVYLSSDIRKLCDWLRTSFKDDLLLFMNDFAAHDATKDDLVQKCLASQINKLDKTHSIVWAENCRLLLLECREYLLGVKGVASRFRMTNKPPPTAPSAYVETILKPIRDFISNHGEIMPEEASVWVPPLAEALMDTYLQQVQTLMETVRQMDTALQRRFKLRAAGTLQPAAAGTSATSVMSDSDKITLQLLLDVKTFGKELSDRFKISELPASYNSLLEELVEADRFLPKAEEAQI